MVGDIAFNLWRKAQSGSANHRDITSTLRNLSSVVLAHIDRNDPADVSRFLLFTDVDEGRYFAPFAYLNNKPTAQALADMSRVLQSGELPEHIVPHDVTTLAGLRKLAAPYSAKAFQDIQRALRD
jgi:hypothetical protein